MSEQLNMPILVLFSAIVGIAILFKLTLWLSHTVSKKKPTAFVIKDQSRTLSYRICTDLLMLWVSIGLLGTVGSIAFGYDVTNIVPGLFLGTVFQIFVSWRNHKKEMATTA